jgi:oligopeptide/dipeptide ABC transporter ATP-binding protein
MSESLLEVSGLVKRFPVGHRQLLTAVDGVDLELRAGETLALIGESGSGKSSVARCITRLIEPTSGEISLVGHNLAAARKGTVWRHYSDLQMVFQDPPASLNPRMTARQTIEEPLRLHTALDRPGRMREVDDLLAQVGLRREISDRYPRQMSGGECQRVAIARALAVSPKVLILDEPTASLDVSVRGQILELLQRLQAERGLAYLFISHDLAVVRHIADRVMVMYLGQVVEDGTVAEVFDNPSHPYTRALLTAAPVAEFGRRIQARLRLDGEIPTPTNLPLGCRLASRCPMALPSCSIVPPDLVQMSSSHSARCPVITGTPKPSTGPP